MGEQDVFEELKKQFKQELAGISDIEELKEVYATELAKRDQLLAKLQEQNQLILRSTFQKKKDELDGV